MELLLTARVTQRVQIVVEDLEPPEPLLRFLSLSCLPCQPLTAPRGYARGFVRCIFPLSWQPQPLSRVLGNKGLVRCMPRTLAVVKRGLHLSHHF